MVLDGEMVVADDTGRTDFQALQSHMRRPGDGRLTYVVFDLLALDGADLRGQPLTERKDILETLMADAPKSLVFSRHVRGGGAASFRAACRARMEGIVGKKAGSVYSGTRNGDWVKIKCGQRQEFVVGGYVLTDKKKGRCQLGSPGFLRGRHVNLCRSGRNRLHGARRIGTGGAFSAHRSC